jgi:hypothetical protein
VLADQSRKTGLLSKFQHRHNPADDTESAFPNFGQDRHQHSYCSSSTDIFGVHNPIKSPAHPRIQAKPTRRCQAASAGASFSHSISAKPRTVVTARSVGLTRIPVSVSMRVRSSTAPSESRPYSESGPSGSTLTQDQADLLGDQMPQPGGPLVQGQLVELGTQFACARCVLLNGAERFGEGLCWAKAVSHGAPVIGA